MNTDKFITNVPRELEGLAEEIGAVRCWVFPEAEWEKVLQSIRANPMRYGVGQW